MSDRILRPGRTKSYAAMVGRTKSCANVATKKKSFAELAKRRQSTAVLEVTERSKKGKKNEPETIELSSDDEMTWKIVETPKRGSMEVAKRNKKNEPFVPFEISSDEEMTKKIEKEPKQVVPMEVTSTKNETAEPSNPRDAEKMDCTVEGSSTASKVAEGDQSKKPKVAINMANYRPAPMNARFKFKASDPCENMLRKLN